MFTKKVLGVLVGCIVLSVATNVLAWDGQRKGFILGGGLGLGMTSFTQTLEFMGMSETSPREDKFGFQTDFKIGYAPTDLLQIYYVSKVSWFELKNVFGDEVTITSGLGGAGVSYYLQPEAPSAFFTGGIGIATWDLPFEERADAWAGFGLYAGAGYEFTRYWNVEFDFVWGNPSEEVSGLKASTNALSLMFTINVLGY